MIYSSSERKCRRSEGSMRQALLLSIKEPWASMILDGSKRVELRRRRPRSSGYKYLIIYVPAPRHCIVGVAAMEEVIEDDVEALWRRVRRVSGLDRREFRSYFAGCRRGFAIRLGKVMRVRTPVTLASIRRIEPGFSPQGYQYLSADRLGSAVRSLRRLSHSSLDQSTRGASPQRLSRS